MMTLRPADERGQTLLDWLDSRHTFSFGEYEAPGHRGFRHLRVLNEDRVRPGEGFPTHGHRDMEILTYVLEGRLEHRDSLGHGSIIQPGELQRMTAGTGITHSEANASAAEPVHFLQVWIVPDRRGLTPGYEQRAFPEDQKRHQLRLLASPDGRDGSVTVHQDVELSAALLDPGQHVMHRLRPGRHAWVQVARGAVAIEDLTLRAGDGVAVSDEELVQIRAEEPSEVLVFDLA